MPNFFDHINLNGAEAEVLGYEPGVYAGHPQG